MAEFTFPWRPVTFERSRHGFRAIVVAAHYDPERGVATVDDEYQGHLYDVAEVLVLSEDSFEFVTEYGEHLVIRHTRPGDDAPLPTPPPRRRETIADDLDD